MTLQLIGRTLHPGSEMASAAESQSLKPWKINWTAFYWWFLLFEIVSHEEFVLSPESLPCPVLVWPKQWTETAHWQDVTLLSQMCCVIFYNEVKPCREQMWLVDRMMILHDFVLSIRLNKGIFKPLCNIFVTDEKRALFRYILVP